MSREPEPWQTSAARPAVVIEKPKGNVSISALGKERFRVEAPGHDSEVEGYDKAQALAHQLAAGLEPLALPLESDGHTSGHTLPISDDGIDARETQNPRSSRAFR